ncbi:hypothetical protein [uncultured Eubacterium sp.]|uniref:hypothetical protein n=1 Tax=uncultured Eubacterium sp. TaxID=165185 RepID=UPI0026732F7E|nr:hypothetical protein [uncultured Eubacterium sp.]
MNTYGRTTKTYPYFPRCIYSENEGICDVEKKHLSEEEKEKLDFKFMKEKCQCKRCIEKRETRKKLVECLKEQGATEVLKMLGEV